MKKRILTVISISTLLIFSSCKKDDVTKVESILTTESGANALVGLSSSLVAYYPFNGNATDESTTNLSTTILGATLTEDRFGNSNSAYSFDGIDDRIEALNDVKIENPNFTVSAWVKSIDETSGIVSLCEFNPGSTNKNNCGYYLGIANNKFRGLTNISSGSWNRNNNPTEECANNTWKHIVFTNDGSNSKLYVNGVLTSTKVNTTTVNYNEHNPLQIGAYAGTTGGAFFEGSLDEIRIYNKDLSVAEVEALYLTDQIIQEVPVSSISGALVAYYPFNNGATDESTTNLSTTVLGATLTEDRFGNSNSAYSFDGIDDRIEALNNSVLENQSFTVSAWVKNIDATSGIVSLCEFNPGSTNKNNCGYYLGIANNKFRGLTNISSGSWNRNNNPTEECANNTWKHIVFTNDGSNSKLYVNGVLTSTKINTTTVNYNEHNPLQIGAYAGTTGGAFFEGSLDEVRIYNRDLTSSEVESLYLIK